MSEAHEWLFCVERYRNTEMSHDADDYMVDGFILLRLPLPEDLERVKLEPEMKTLIGKLQAPEQRDEVKKNFPKFHGLLVAGGLWWIHLMRKDYQERLPKDFHTNSFTEEELLGIEPAQDPSLLPREMWFDRDGDPIEGPPDRLMALLYG
ncbi:MAG: hypothetical protein IPK50_23790 [Fibrobacterota bacterium]|nr:hypothetical protein [Fibrobacterota bacterium]QQS05256.1 MAG: hypothetical protein IPK50_23790 [Fibrobacterota bacterium]